MMRKKDPKTRKFMTCLQEGKARPADIHLFKNRHISFAERKNIQIIIDIYQFLPFFPC
jgi:hypothetical protein